MDLLKTLTLAASILLFSQVGQAQSVSRVHVSGVSITHDNHNVEVSFTVDPRKWHLGLERKTTVTPLLVSADGKDSLALQPFTVAGKNAWYQVVRDGGDTSPASMLLRAGKGENLSYHATTPLCGWMNHSHLSFIEVASCYCDGDVPRPPLAIPVAEIDWRKKKFPSNFKYVVPPVDTVKVLTRSGRGYVNFKVNRTEIAPDYMNNSVELQKIINAVNELCDDKDITVRDISITGYASPEGPYANNERLAKGRTQAIVEYMLSLCPIDASVMHSSWVAEDWDGLKAWMETSDMAYRDAILAIINSNRAPDNKDWVIKSTYPEQYAFLLKNVYPSLRHTDYVITYNIRTYTDIAEIRQLMKERPQNLSLNELFIGATSYPEGSQQYAEAFQLAASLYPQSEVANLNASMAALAAGNPQQAAPYLQHAGVTPPAHYARGVFYAMQGDYSAALLSMQEAADAGYTPATDAIIRIKALESHPDGVTFIESDNP